MLRTRNRPIRMLLQRQKLYFKINVFIVKEFSEAMEARGRHRRKMRDIIDQLFGNYDDPTSLGCVFFIYSIIMYSNSVITSSVTDTRKQILE